MRRFPSLVLLIVILSGGFAMTAEDAGGLAKTGLVLMQQADAEPRKIIDAAVAFYHALELYKKAGDDENVLAMQANIYWCKKKMNAEQIREWLAAKSSKAALTTTVTPDKGPPQVVTTKEAATEAAKAEIAKVTAVAERKVEVSESKAFFDRADAWVKRNPDKHLEIAIRWFEVADRFPDTVEGRKAQRLSLESQTQYAKKAVETLFTAPAFPSAGAVPPPAPATQQTAVESIRRLLAEDYTTASYTTAKKQALARKLLDQGRATADDPAVRWASLQEAGRLAIETSSYQVLVGAANQLGISFLGVDATALKKEWVKKLMNQPIASTVMTLLDDPTNPEANTAAGDWFILKGGDFDLGLPMWARGKKAETIRLAEQEIAKPTAEMQQIELGDGWYALAGRQIGKDREVPFDRARYWYEKARPKATGLTLEKLKKRIDEVDLLIPPPVKDWATMTVAQWNSLPGREIQASASLTAREVLVLKAGDKVRVVPHPTEQWELFAALTSTFVPFKGGIAPPRLNAKGKRFGRMELHFDNAEVNPCGVIAGPGRLLISTDVCGADQNNTVKPRGAIRIKFVPVSEDTPVGGGIVIEDEKPTSKTSDNPSKKKK